uniref:Uncharacterized protein n=1 Tax=Rhizophora mucronata TaxID=61149 RepID=A0A2P2NEH1_RHIMU
MQLLFSSLATSNTQGKVNNITH